VLPTGAGQDDAGVPVKAAFCFLTRGDLLQPGPWEAFFETAPTDHYSLYCHPKAPEQVTGRLLAGRVIAERVETRHGHISLVEASLALFAAAFEDPQNQYFILQSESAVPIVPFRRAWDGLADAGGRSLIPYRLPAKDTDDHARLKTVENAHLFEQPFFQHSQWIVLHRRHVALLLDRAHLSWFEPMFAPDEHYFLNVLAHLKDVKPDEISGRQTTFVNWRDHELKTYVDTDTGEVFWRTAHPRTYDVVTAADLAEAGSNWFFRKVSATADCGLLIERVQTRD
jgi:hypothetical protein